ncbi:MAG: hypothetical protein Q3962_05045 [Corynebacterium sp.]|nr:hypothetical protein [Corynebacterium sp.]
MSSNKKQNLKDPKQVTTAPIVATGLISSWVVAEQTGVRPVGGSIVGIIGGYSAWCWLKKSGPVKAAGLLAGYIAASFGAHILDNKLGKIPSVLITAGLAAVAAYFVNDKN